jgi:hypothetical protein
MSSADTFFTYPAVVCSVREVLTAVRSGVILVNAVKGLCGSKRSHYGWPNHGTVPDFHQRMRAAGAIVISSGIRNLEPHFQALVVQFPTALFVAASRV